MSGAFKTHIPSSTHYFSLITRMLSFFYRMLICYHTNFENFRTNYILNIGKQNFQKLKMDGGRYDARY